MIVTRAILKIPGDRVSATIVSVDDSCIYFEGNEDQTARMTFAIPPMVGGNMYTVSEGNLFGCGDVKCFKIEGGAGLGNDVEIEFKDNIVRRTSVFWS